MKALLALFPALAAAALRSKVAREVSVPSVQSMEAAIAQLIQRKKEPVSQELVNDIKTLLADTVMPHLHQQQQRIQAQLDAASQHFEECKAVTPGRERTALLHAEHESCRYAESAAVDQNATCISELESLEAVKDERCRAFDELNQIPETSCAVRSGENATAWYVRTLAELHWAQERLVQSAARCNAARLAHTEKMGTCADAQKDLASLRASCDAKQLALDQAGCDLYDSARANCSAEEACYQQRRSSHDLLLANARHQEKTLKVEFEALLRMQCLLETFSHRHLEEAIDECKDKKHYTENMSLVYHNISITSNCSVPGDLKPGTATYERRLFAALPDVVPSRCAATCCASQQLLLPLEPVYQAVHQCYSFRAAYSPPLIPGEERTVEDTAGDCQQRCKRTAGCGGFSYTWDGGCFVAHQSATKIFQPGVVAGPMDCLGIPNECYGYNRKFTPELDGHAGGAVKVTSEEECQKRCFETVGCGHWILWWDMRCHLAGADASMSYEPGTVSGPSQCVQVVSVVT